MDDNQIIRQGRQYLEQRLSESRRKFELLLSTAKEDSRVRELTNVIKAIERDYKKLQADLFTRDDCARYNINIDDISEYILSDGEEKSVYKILRNVPVEKLNKYSDNDEINAIWSYLQYFGREYLGLLSEQNMRLDYGHAYQRDRFYNSFNETLRVLSDYGGILEQMETANGKEAKERLIRLQSKQYRDVIVITGKFIQTIRSFVEDIFKSETNGEKVLLEPEKIVSIAGDLSTLDGVTTRQALHDLQMFVNEFIKYLKIPDLKKIEDDDR